MEKPLIPNIAIFVRVVELGTFAAVAEEIELTSSGVSRVVSRLEKHLGVKLLHRSTRRLTLSPEGELFLSYAVSILTTVKEAEAGISMATGAVSGHLRINCGTAYARYKLTPALPAFLKQYPGITIDLTVCDQRIDPIIKQADVTIRVGVLTNSDLIPIRIGTVRRVIAASQSYLAGRGTPKTTDDLLDHDCLLLTGFAGQALWPMIKGGKRVKIGVKGSVTSDSADVLLHMAIAGVGIIRLGDFLGAEALSTKQLVPLLTEYHDTDPQPLTALVLPGRQVIPKIRAFIDFLKTLG